MQSASGKPTDLNGKEVIRKLFALVDCFSQRVTVPFPRDPLERLHAQLKQRYEPYEARYVRSTDRFSADWKTICIKSPCGTGKSNAAVQMLLGVRDTLATICRQLFPAGILQKEIHERPEIGDKKYTVYTWTWDLQVPLELMISKERGSQALQAWARKTN